MANDIKLIFDNDTGEADINFADNDVVIDEGLETLVFVSLFTNRRANDDDVLPDPSKTLDRGGWWGDETSDNPDDKIGSRLWLLDRAKTLDSILVQAESFAREALQWMIDEKIAIKIDVTAEKRGTVTNPILALIVQIFKKDGNKEVFEFEEKWEAQFNGS